MNIPKLIIDIETVGEDFDSLDKTSQEVLTNWIKKTSRSDEEYQANLEYLKDGMGLSPLTGEIVAIGVLDYHQDKGVVYYQAPESDERESTEENYTFKPTSEKDMLQSFWQGALKYDHFITFNGRSFDIPFLNLRSAIHNIKPSKDLMRGRYLYQQNVDAMHIDLFDQFGYYGSTRKNGSIHMYCRAFGVDSPKDKGVKGDDVARLFKEKKYLDIARYNVDDLKATAGLYEKWDKYLRF
jgi:hypothetical protein